MKRCVPSLVIREMKIRIIRGYFIPTWWAKCKNLMLSRDGENMEQCEPLWMRGSCEQPSEISLLNQVNLVVLPVGK